MFGQLGRLPTVWPTIFIGLACCAAPASADRPRDHPFSVTWTDFGHNKDLNDIHFANERHGWAVGEGGTILATTDGGTTWKRQSSKASRTLVGVHFGNEMHGWVVGQSGTILVATDGGETWQLQQPPRGQQRLSLNGVHFANEMHGWVVGQSGTILKTANGGKFWDVRTWQDPRAGIAQDLAGGTGRTPNVDLYAVQFLADGNTGWAVGAGGTILATTDAGANWELRFSGTDKRLTGVHFANKSTGWVVGIDGTIRTTIDGGATWNPQTSGTDRNIRAVRFADERTVGARTGNAETPRPNLRRERAD